MTYLEGFCLDCEARGLTRHTIQTYRSNLKDFLEIVPDPLWATQDDLRKYLLKLRANNPAGSTLKGHFSALSMFYEYLIYEGQASYNPILPIRKRYLSQIKPVTGGENERQLISIQNMIHLILRAESPLDIAILMVLAKTGIRRGELLGMVIDSIDFQNGIIRLPAKAKRSQRIAFIDTELYIILKKYIQWRSSRAISPWLWINKNTGKKMDRDYPGELISSLAIPLGLHQPRGPLCYRLTPHCFRHFFTTHLFRAGMEPQYIMWLRGDSMGRQSWQIYNHIDPESVRIEYLRRVPKLISNNSVLPDSEDQACRLDRIEYK
ncbi:MAG: tyrosine-type recombinase/integrase [Clostridia bacterium]|nr:tyrosine-type recombinase/integrase [Clostridia bacterium]